MTKRTRTIYSTLAAGLLFAVGMWTEHWLVYHPSVGDNIISWKAVGLAILIVATICGYVWALWDRQRHISAVIVATLLALIVSWQAHNIFHDYAWELLFGIGLVLMLFAAIQAPWWYRFGENTAPSTARSRRGLFRRSPRPVRGSI